MFSKRTLYIDIEEKIGKKPLSMPIANQNQSEFAEILD